MRAIEPYNLMPTNQWQNIQYIPSVDDVAKLTFSPSVIGMMRFIKYFNYYYLSKDAHIEYFKNRFIIHIPCKNNFWISIAFLLSGTAQLDNEYHWFIQGSMYNTKSGGSYNDTGKFYITYPVSEIFDQVMTRIDHFKNILKSEVTA